MSCNECAVKTEDGYPHARYCVYTERDRYRRALEKMVIPGSGMSCTCGVCYICIALDALRVTDEKKD